MSQSLRTPKGIAIRAVAAAALYASKRDSQHTDEAAGAAARDAERKKAAFARKPQPKN